MAVKRLNDGEKSLIVEWFTKKIYTKLELSKKFGVSTRTVGRVIEERGYDSYERPISNTKRINDTMKEYGVTVDTLEAALQKPDLNLETVFHFLCDQEEQDLALVYYRIGLVKLHEKYEAVQMEASKGDSHDPLSH